MNNKEIGFFKIETSYDIETAFVKTQVEITGYFENILKDSDSLIYFKKRMNNEVCPTIGEILDEIGSNLKPIHN